MFLPKGLFGLFQPFPLSLELDLGLLSTFLPSSPECYTLLKLLRSENETVAGNAAFCLGKCLEVPGTATKLLDTDVVKLLLKLAVRDVEKDSVQENAAVALGKLCTADPRYLWEWTHKRGVGVDAHAPNPVPNLALLLWSCRHICRLRELNGMAVLSDSMKHLQIH